MRLLRSERGEGGMKGLILLAVLAYGVFCAVKIMGAKSNDRSLDTKVDELLKFATVNHIKTEEDVRYNVGKLIKEYDIPFKVEDVTIESSEKEWRVAIAYERQVPLMFWTWKAPIKIDKRGPR